jgi:hypothetical protein
MMRDPKDVFIMAHRDNIRRYHRLLQTHLTDIERSYIQSRLSEEKSALQSVEGQSPKLRGMVTDAANRSG